MGLKVLSWNCHSFNVHKKTELQHLLKKNCHEIICLSESWLKPEWDISLNNYNCYRQDRTRGGVVLMIDPRIPHSSVRRISLSYAEAVTITIDDPSGSFKVSSIYCSPSCTRDESKKFYEKVMSIPGRHVITGDFNAKHASWGNPKNCRKGLDIFNLCSNKNYKIFHPNAPTSIPPNGNGSIIDFAIARSIPDITSPLVIKDLPSDHFPISFSIQSASEVAPEKKNSNFRKANWKLFRSVLNCNLHPMLSESNEANSQREVDACIDNFTSSIAAAADLAIPKRNPFTYRYPFSTDVQNLIKHRNFFRNQYRKHGRKSDSSCMQQLNRMIRQEITKINQRNFNDKLASLMVQDNSIWAMTKSLKNKKSAIPPLESPNGSIAYTNQEKANAFANAFHSAHLTTVNEKSPHERSVRKSRKIISKIPTHSASKDFVAVSALGLKAMVGTLKAKKAPGPDLITNLLLKNLPSTAFTVIASTFNKCLELGYFPTRWKEAKVIAIPKPGKNLKLPTNYRPISLLSCIGKLFEKVALERLSDHEEQNKIFIQEQFGFVKQRGTVQQVLRITQKATINFNKNKSTGLVLLDLEKAFDSVWHDGLLHKLLSNRYPNYLIKLMSSFLCDRSAFVETKGEKSTQYPIPAGVPQGSLLSPHLFNIFVNDIPTPHNCEIAMFADDTGLICDVPWKNAKSITKTLTGALEVVSDYFGEWKIRLNKSKTEFTVFTKSPKMIRKLNESPPVFQNETFSWKPEVEYLGVTLDQKLLFKAHIEKSTYKTKALLYKSLYCIMKRNNSTPTDTKLQVYRSVIRPIMTYACPVFNNAAATHLNKLQVVQNNALRLALNAEWSTPIIELHKEANVPTIREFIDKLTANFYDKAKVHDNSLINSLGNYTKDNLGFRLKHRLPLKI
jgi:endonuclease/exonuclease/phosphatase family metal-dependent hydrolase